MSEIQKSTSQYVYLDVYGGVADATPTATFTDVYGATRALVVEHDLPAPSGIDDRYHVVLTMADTQNEGNVSVTWTFAIGGVPVSKVDAFHITTPYLSIAEVKKVWTGCTDEQAVDVEAAVRLIINAHTGQSFGFSTDKTILVEGHGESALRLPERLLELKALSTRTANLNPLSAIIVSDGWYLKKGWSDEVTPIVDTSTYWSGWERVNDAAPGEPGYEKSGHGTIIVPPGGGGRPTKWRDDYPFAITGDWGYRTIPAAVKEAARLLVNDYACSEQLYRDRYLESIKAADWRLQFNSRAWEYTGNVRADQLLSEFVLLDWAAI